jgi:hypothetical protein
MMDLGLLVLKILGIVGGAAVGALLVGFIMQLAARGMRARPLPRPVLNTLRVLGAVAAGLAVWLWVFGPPGPGGFGGSGGWWPFGQKGQSGGAGSGGTGRSTGDETPRTTPPAPEARDTLTIQMRGGDEAERDQKFWVIQGDVARDWESATRAILERRQGNAELKFLKIVTVDASVADNHPAVLKLKQWAREQGLETIGP